MVNFVDSSDMRAVYAMADALVYPSLMEGFGMPIVEAMKCGTPVITSNISCLPEVSGGAALLVDPLDPEDIASGIQKIISDPALKNLLIERGFTRAKEFSWHKTAEEYLKLYENLLHR